MDKIFMLFKAGQSYNVIIVLLLLNWLLCKVFESFWLFDLDRGTNSDRRERELVQGHVRVFYRQVRGLRTVPKPQLVAYVARRQSADGEHRDPENSEKKIFSRNYIV